MALNKASNSMIEGAPVNVKDFGAVGDGVTDDTAAIQAALTYATPSSFTSRTATDGNSVYLPAGEYLISSELTIPAWVNINGDGKAITRIICNTASSGLTFGPFAVPGTGNGERGGESGGFTVDGNSVATTPFAVNQAVLRDFSNIDSTGSAGDALQVYSAQNCTFYQCDFNNCGDPATAQGNCLTVDYGAGNNRFIACEFNQAARHHVLFRQQGTSPNGAFTRPTYNRFIGCIFERSLLSSGASSVVSVINHEAGLNNLFDNCEFGLINATKSTPIIEMRKDWTVDSTSLVLNDARMNGVNAHTVCFDIDNDCIVYVNGATTLLNHATAFKIGDSAKANIESPVLSNVTTQFANQSGGTATQDTLLVRPTTIATQFIEKYATTSNVLTTGTASDSNARFVLQASGEHKWGNGSSATDLSIYRGNLGGQVSLVVSTAGIGIKGNQLIYTGTGVPTRTVNDGSLYIRSDGAAGTFLYGRISGAWVAIA